MTDNIIEVRNLSFKRASRVIFDGVNLDVPRGKITAIMGPSGTGKTTMLKLMSGQLLPQSGSIKMDGIEVPSLSNKELYKLRRNIGMLFQNGALFTDISTYDNVAFPLREHTKLPASMIRDLVLLKLESVGLRGARNLMPSELSGGMARRAALARTIALDPDLILYDEPFTGQDPISMGVLVKLIKELNDTLNMTSVIVSHDVAETCSIADYVYVIADSKIIGHGTPDDLKRSDSKQVEQFIQGLPDGPVPFHFPAPSLKEDLLEGAAIL